MQLARRVPAPGAIRAERQTMSAGRKAKHLAPRRQAALEVLAARNSQAGQSVTIVLSLGVSSRIMGSFFDIPAWTISLVYLLFVYWFFIRTNPGYYARSFLGGSAMAFLIFSMYYAYWSANIAPGLNRFDVIPPDICPLLHSLLVGFFLSTPTAFILRLISGRTRRLGCTKHAGDNAIPKHKDPQIRLVVELTALAVLGHCFLDLMHYR